MAPTFLQRRIDECSGRSRPASVCRREIQNVALEQAARRSVDARVPYLSRYRIGFRFDDDHARRMADAQPASC